MSQLDGTRYAPTWKRRRWLPTALWAAAGVGAAAAFAGAQQPPRPPVVEFQRAAFQQPAPAPTAVPDKGEVKVVPKAEPEKTISVHWEGAGWQEVLDWYAKETGLILVTTVRPTGSVTIKPGPNRKFTLSEVTDLLNEAMISQKFLIVRYQTSFTVWPADEPLHPTRLPRVSYDELGRRGKTEIVLCNVGPFKAISAPEVMPEVEKMVTPGFGKAILLTNANAIQVMDTAGNITRIAKTLEEYEKGGGQAESITHVCKWRRAPEMAAVLERLLKDDQTRIEGSGAAPAPFGASPFGQPQFGGNPYFPQPGGGDPRRDDRGRDPRGSSPYPSASSRTKTVQIVVDGRRNAVLITAPPEKITLAQEIIREFDKKTSPDQREIVVAPPEYRTYPVQAGTADAMAKILQEKNASIRVIAIPASNQLMVYGTPEEHAEVLAQIRGSADPMGGNGGGMVTKFIALQNLEPGNTAATLGKLFPSSTAGGPVLEPQTGLNAGILFRGTQAQLDEVERAIRALDPNAIGGAGFQGRTLNLTLENGNAGILAEALANAMRGMNKNPVIVQNLGGLPGGAPPAPPAPRPTPGITVPPGTVIPYSPPPMGVPMPPPGGLAPPAGVMPAPMPLPAPLPNGRSRLDGPFDPRFVLAQIVDPARQPLPPVVIRVIGNRMQIESDDPAALQVISELVRLYSSQAKPDENLFEVIRLKYVGAAEAAKVVSEVFNGPQQQQGGGQQGGGRGPGGGGGGPGGLLGGLLGGGGGGLLGGLLGGGAAGAPAPGRIRVVAETSSNSLIVVKATQLDLLTIRKLLANVIDSGETDSEAIQRTNVIALKNTEAAEMAVVVRDVFKQAIQPTGGGGGGANPLFPFIPQPQGGGGGNQQRPPAMSVGVDERTNSLVILASETLFREVKALVDQLDSANATNGAEVVRVVPIRGIDPAMVRQLVDAVQGRDSANSRVTGQPRTGQGGTGTTGGMGGFPGLGGGGGFPGLGGGGFPGLGGGGRTGGGGGFTPGGGGGARPGGGATGGGRGGRQANLGGENPSNFDHRGMDAPPAMSRTIYDPETDPEPWLVTAAADLPAPVAPAAGGRRRLPAGIFLASHQVPAQPLPAAQPPMMTPPPLLPGGGAPPNTGIGIAAPRGPVTAQSLDDLGLLILTARDERDMQLILQLIEFLRLQVGDRAEPELRLINLKHADCNVLAGTLNTVFSKVSVGLGGNVVPAASRQVTPGNALSALTGAPSSTQNVYVIAMPRTNGLLIAGPKGRFEDILKEVERLDVPNGADVRPKAIPLKHASAQIVAQQIRTLYSQRFPQEGPPNTQVRISFDLASNSVLVQAAPSDLADIEAMLHQIDNAISPAVNEVKVYRLRNALADEVAGILIQAITANTVNPQLQATNQWYIQSVTGGTGALGGLAALAQGGGPGGLQGLQQGAQGQQGALQGLQQLTQPGGGAGLGQTAPGLNATVPQVGATAGGGLSTRSNTLRIVTGGQEVKSGLLSDVHIIPASRINGIMVTAPTQTIALIDRLVESLDTVAAASSFVNVFELKKSDAVLTGILLQQLFTGQGRTALTPGGGAQGQQGLNQGAAGTTAARPLLTLTGNPADGASLIDLRISIDDRTNSLIVAGSQNDLDTIRAIVTRLEAADVQQRMFDVYKLRNAAAADVATNLQTFLTNSLTVTGTAGFNSAYAQLMRSVVIVAEPVSNTVLISATPQYFAELKRIIERIDAQPPQVLIQVMIVDIALNNAQEFGAEVGLQSPIVFGRGTAGNTPGTPGFNFNASPVSALPNNNLFNQGVVGFQGLGNLGVGRVGAGGLSGFVFSAQSQSFNLLIRALSTQGRVDILSRPQVQVTDNQTGFVQVGQDFPVPGAVSQGVAGNLQGIDYRPTGVTMRVTPRVNPDGKVLMRVEPQISSPGAPVSIGTAGQAFPFNVQTIQTTILAGDGETVVLGGLITNQDTRAQNGVPFLEDIPYVGALFRYRTQNIQRREILIIMTPHIIRTEADQARVLAEEARRIEFCPPDVARIHGHGMEVIGPALRGATPTPIPGFQQPNGPLPGGFQFGPTPPWVPPTNWVPPDGPGAFPSFVPPGAALPGPTPLPDGMGATLPTIPPSPFPTAAPAGVPVGVTLPAFVPSGPYTPAGTVAPASAAAPAAAAATGRGFSMTLPQPPAPPAPPPPPAPVPVPGRGFAVAEPPAPPAAPARTAPPTTPAREGRSWNVFGR